MSVWVNQTSNHGDAVLMTTYKDDYIARGYGFAIEDVFTINTGVITNLLIDYTSYTDFTLSNTDHVRDPRVGMVFILPPYMATTAGPVLISAYREGDYTGGLATIYSKRNTLSDVEPQITITQDATGTDKGELFLQWLVGGEATNQSSGGLSTHPQCPFIRDNKGKTLLEITNQSGFNIEFSYQQIFFEI